MAGPIEEALEGFVVGDDFAYEMVVYTTPDQTAVEDTSSWASPGGIRLDIRKKDTSSDPPTLAVDGVRSGVFNANPAINTQKWTFTITDDDSSATKFKGDDPTYRHSFKRMTPGAERVLRFGDVPVIRTTQV